ncbi:MAG: DUF11 domain-containing protein, partial [Halobacteriales archaeon]|nr:DUF11 domain-containing protein [Halobacteriales archaeon]
SSAVADPNSADNTNSTESTTVLPDADLSVVKDRCESASSCTSPPADETPGENVYYRIRVTNESDDDVPGDGARLVDDLDETKLDVANADWSCDDSGLGSNSVCPGTLTDGADLSADFTIGNGDTIVFKVTVPILPGATGDLTNSATVSIPDPGTTGVADPDPTDDTDDDTVTLVPETDIEVTIGDVSTVVAGTQMTYTVTVNNLGPSDATGVEVDITLTLPGGVSVDSTTPSVGSYSSGTWTIGPLTAAATPPTLEIVLDVPSSTSKGETISIEADGSSTTADPDSSNNLDITRSTTVETKADLVVVEKLSCPGSTTFPCPNADSVLPGESLTYRVKVTNEGPSDALNVALDDVLLYDLIAVHWT